MQVHFEILKQNGVDPVNGNVSLLEQKINKSLYNYTGGQLKKSNSNDEELQDFTTDESRAVIDNNIVLLRKHKESWDVFGDF